MRYSFIILLFFISSCVFAQTSFLKDAVIKLDKALIAKDTVTLKQLLHKEATYGHSNGWVETKQDVIKDLVSGKLTYHKIETDSLTWKVNDNWATMRNKTTVEGSVNGTKFNLVMHVLQVWLKTNKGWQLLARQSAKL
jgi:hypothetical protein